MRKLAQCFCITLCALGPLGSETALADEITLVADPWCPYNCQPDDPDPGILIEVAQQAFAKTGHTVVYKTLPWQRAIKAVRNGKFSGIVGTGLEETPDFIFTDKEILTVDHTFFIKKDDDWRYQNLASLADRKIGAIQGYSYGDFHLKYIQPNAADKDRVLLITGDAPLRRLLNLLEIGRVDTLIEDRTAFEYSLRNLPGLKLIKAAGIYTKEKIFIAFSPARATSGTYARILGDFVAENHDSLVPAIISKYVR